MNNIQQAEECLTCLSRIKDEIEELVEEPSSAVVFINIPLDTTKPLICSGAGQSFYAIGLFLNHTLNIDLEDFNDFLERKSNMDRLKEFM